MDAKNCEDGFLAFERNGTSKSGAIQLQRTPTSLDKFLRAIDKTFKFYTCDVTADDDLETHKIVFEAFSESAQENSITGKIEVGVGDVLVDGKILKPNDFEQDYMTYDELHSASKFKSVKGYPDALIQRAALIAKETNLLHVETDYQTRLKTIYDDDWNDKTDEFIDFLIDIINESYELKDMHFREVHKLLMKDSKQDMKITIYVLKSSLSRFGHLIGDIFLNEGFRVETKAVYFDEFAKFNAPTSASVAVVTIGDQEVVLKTPIEAAKFLISNGLARC